MSLLFVSNTTLGLLPSDFQPPCCIMLGSPQITHETSVSCRHLLADASHDTRDTRFGPAWTVLNLIPAFNIHGEQACRCRRLDRVHPKPCRIGNDCDEECTGESNLNCQEGQPLPLNDDYGRTDKGDAWLSVLLCILLNTVSKPSARYLGIILEM
jgi:hypothetical protein